MSITKPARWEMLVSSMLDGFFVVEDGRFAFANESCARLLGVDDPDRLIGRNVFDFVAESERQRVLGNYRNRLEGKPAPRHYETRVLCADGSGEVEVWLEVSELTREEDGSLVLACTLRDIRELQQLKNELEDARLQLNIILENMSDAIYRTNMDGEVTLISKNVEQLLGYSQQEMIGTRLADYYWTPEERERVVEAITRNRGKITNVEAILRRKDGTPVWISTNAYVRVDEASGEPVSIEGIARDVTRQKELELKLEKLALTDSLTHLPNRRALMDELNRQFVRARETKAQLSLLYIDANRFKAVNDRYGHLVGDNLLRHMAMLLKNHASGNQMIGRLSGDEFLFILPAVDNDQAQKLARLIQQDVQARPMPLEQQQLSFSLAVGISSLKDEDVAEYSLLARADKAMYLSKGRAESFAVL